MYRALQRAAKATTSKSHRFLRFGSQASPAFSSSESAAVINNNALHHKDKMEVDWNALWGSADTDDDHIITSSSSPTKAADAATDFEKSISEAALDRRNAELGFHKKYMYEAIESCEYIPSDVEDREISNELDFINASRLGYPLLKSEDTEAYSELSSESLQTALSYGRKISSLLHLNVDAHEVGLICSKFHRYALHPSLNEAFRCSTMELLDRYFAPLSASGDLNAIKSLLSNSKDSGDIFTSYVPPYLADNVQNQLEVLHYTKLMCCYDALTERLSLGSAHYENRFPVESLEDALTETQDLQELIAKSLSCDNQAMLYGFLKQFNTRSTGRSRVNVNFVITNILAIMDHEPNIQSVLPKLTSYFSNRRVKFDAATPLLSEYRYHMRRERKQLYLQAIVECRMRMGHRRVRGLDAGISDGVFSFRQVREKEKVSALAWNVARAFSDSRYHHFFNRIFRHKTLIRGNKGASEVLMREISKIVGPRAMTVMSSELESSIDDVTIEGISSAYRKSQLPQHRDHLVESLSIYSCDDVMKSNLVLTEFKPERTVMYTNVPTSNFTEENMKATLSKIGKVKNVRFFDRDAVSEFRAGKLKNRKRVPMTKTTSKNQKPRKANKKVVVHSDAISTRVAMVEFKGVESYASAMTPAISIFGVVAKHDREIRTLFGHDVSQFTKVMLSDIQYGTLLEDVLNVIRENLPEGKALDDFDEYPDGTRIFEGKLELNFSSYEHAAAVVSALSSYLEPLEAREVPEFEKVKFKTAEDEKRELVQELESRKENTRPFEIRWIVPKHID